MPKGNDFLNPDNLPATSQEGDNEYDNLVLNLESVSEEGPVYEAMPPGIYDAVVENAVFGPSKQNNPMITWTFKLLDPQFEGRLLFYHTTLHNEQGQSRLKRMLLRVYPDVQLSEFSPRNFCDNGDGLGYECRLKVVIQRYQGKKTNSVSDVLPPADAGSGYLEST
jgi:hypothetical protein